MNHTDQTNVKSDPEILKGGKGGAMSDFSYSSYASFIFQVGPSGVGFYLQSHTFTPGTLTDGDNDDQFESGDTISAPVTGTYGGTYVDAMISYPGFANGSGLGADGYIFFDNPVTAPAFFPGFNFGNYSFCFIAGTEIATPGDAIKVENLEIGDEIKTADGQIIPVKWIGTQTIIPAFADKAAQPVLVSTGSLGAGTPNQDLIVTADHGLLIDDLVPRFA